MIDNFEELINRHKDLEDTPWWAEYLGIDIKNWPRERLIKLYLYKQYSSVEIIKELYERLDELKATIFTKDKLIKELEEKYKKEQVAKRFYREQETKMRKKLEQRDKEIDRELN